jgi:hypothetical protein
LNHWTSPFPVPQRCRELLGRLGLVQQPQAEPDAACLWLYDAPDQVLIAAAEAGVAITASNLVAGYRRACEPGPSSRLMSCWRLQAIPEHVLVSWLHEGQPLNGMLPGGLHVTLPDPSPLAALLALQLLQSHTSLRDAYLDLELRSELAGTAPDSECMARYCGQSDAGILLQTWQSLEQELLGKDELLSGSQAEIEKLHCQLQGVSEALSTLQQQLLVQLEEGQLSGLQAQQLQDELQRLHLSTLAKDTRIDELEAIHAELAKAKDKVERRLNRTQLLLRQATQIIAMLRSRSGGMSRTRLLPPAHLPTRKG